jgi:DNA-nicking Smr family endonuclease
MSRGRRSPSAAEVALWHAALRDVRPLPGRKAPPPDTPKPAAPKIDTELPPPPGDAAPVQLRSRRAAGLDKRSADRLRRGELPIDGRIDLHGLTQDEAHRALGAFLGRAQTEGDRCVLVITGKGVRRAGESEAGVLRQAVPRWLEEAPNRGRVLAFTAAQTRHGGSGALYVLLRRKR